MNSRLSPAAHLSALCFGRSQQTATKRGSRIDQCRIAEQSVISPHALDVAGRIARNPSASGHPDETPLAGILEKRAAAACPSLFFRHAWMSGPHGHFANPFLDHAKVHDRRFSQIRRSIARRERLTTHFLQLNCPFLPVFITQ